MEGEGCLPQLAQSSNYLLPSDSLFTVWSCRLNVSKVSELFLKLTVVRPWDFSLPLPHFHAVQICGAESRIKYVLRSYLPWDGSWDITMTRTSPSNLELHSP